MLDDSQALAGSGEFLETQQAPPYETFFEERDGGGGV